MRPCAEWSLWVNRIPILDLRNQYCILDTVWWRKAAVTEFFHMGEFLYIPHLLRFTAVIDGAHNVEVLLSYLYIHPLNVTHLIHILRRCFVISPLDIYFIFLTLHDDVIKWKFSALLVLCSGFSNKGQWRGDLIFSLICARINGWVNIREDGDLRRLRAHYDVIVLIMTSLINQARMSR